VKIRPTTWTRREMLAMAGGAAVLAAGRRSSARNMPTARTPVIDITDLYHPPQDPGDNFDLIAAYGLPDVDLRAVILDVTARYRRPYVTLDGAYNDPEGHRDPGFIPVTQLNALFNRNVPCAVGPYEVLRRPDDPMTDAPAFQQAGVKLLLDTLQASEEPVEVVSFGSARPLAVAYNREPELLRRKVRRVHLCAGAAPPGYLEWNVNLDPKAFIRLLRSDLPVAIYPCATETGPFELGPHNTFWRLPNLEFIRNMPPPLQRYCAFAFERSQRMDFLCALEDDLPGDVLDRVCARSHAVWETAVWTAVAGRRLVRRADGAHRLVPAAEVRADDTVLPNDLWPCRITVQNDGQFTFERAPASETNFAIYYRGDPAENERALREALPALYGSFLL